MLLNARKVLKDGKLHLSANIIVWCPFFLILAHLPLFCSCASSYWLLAVEVNAMHAPHVVALLKASATHVPRAVAAALDAATRVALMVVLRALLP